MEGFEPAVIRVLDANANRASEALRVVEDFARLVLEDPHFSHIAKLLRHDLATALLELGANDRVRCRDTSGDVGTGITTSQEFERSDYVDIVVANLKRLEQALRVMEEFGKLGSSGLAAACKQLRYRGYTLEKAIVTTLSARAMLAGRTLQVLIDGGSTPADFEQTVEAIVAGGASMIQLRDKSLTDGELLRRATRLRQLTRGTPTLAIANDRADLAVAAGLDGVHVGQDDLPVAAVRSIVGPRRLVGLSTHSIEQARAGVLAGADYLGVGPVFASQTKSFAQLPGPTLLSEVAAEITLPAFAIGGIGLDQLAAVRDAGFARIAVSGAIQRAEDVASAVRQLVERLAAPNTAL